MDNDTEYTTAPATKAELLERSRAEHAALEQALAGLSEAQMTAPIENGWTIKDILAHLTAWEGILRQFHMGSASFNEASGLDDVVYGRDDVEQVNTALYRRDKSKPLAEVLAAFQQSYEQLLAAIEALDERRLFQPYTPRGRTTTGPLIDWIAGDTYEHYREHRLTIQGLVG
jgi:uncharacterized protein (TIGR03083 family)